MDQEPPTLPFGLRRHPLPHAPATHLLLDAWLVISFQGIHVVDVVSRRRGICGTVVDRYLSKKNRPSRAPPTLLLLIMPSTFTSRGSTGLFLAVEGPDGIGKSTVIQGLAEKIREETGESLLLLREPGSTPRGEEYRNILLADSETPLDRREELFLYCASRVAMLEQKVRPALSAGQIVLTDRFALSTYAYQGGVGGVADADIQDVVRIAVGDLWPEMTLVLTLDERELKLRMDAREGPKDRIESDEERLRSAVARYRNLVHRAPGAREVSAAGAREEVLARVWSQVQPLLKARRQGVVGSGVNTSFIPVSSNPQPSSRRGR